MNNKVYCSKFFSLGGFPSLLFLRFTPKWCYPQLLLEYNAESSVNKLWFCQYLVIGKSP